MSQKNHIIGQTGMLERLSSGRLYPGGRKGFEKRLITLYNNIKGAKNMSNLRSGKKTVRKALFLLTGAL